jgi:guanylate kinase
MKNKNILVTICGPSTTGKSTFTQLLKEYGYSSIVTTTTRPMRTGEIQGVSYNFVSEDEFNKMIKNEDLIEYNNIGKYSYGTSKKAVLTTIKESNGMIVMEPYGANNLYEFCLKNDIPVHKIYLNNPIEKLIERLQDRYLSDQNAKEEVYKERLWSLAFIEPKEWTEKAYSKEHYYDQIFNEFDSANDKQVVQKVITAIKNKHNKSNKP